MSAKSRCPDGYLNLIPHSATVLFITEHQEKRICELYLVYPPGPKRGSPKDLPTRLHLEKEA